MIPRRPRRRPSTATVPPTATFPPTITPTLSPTVAPPSDTPLPTNTPGPFDHSIRAGDDCIAIVYQYGHVDLGVLEEFYNLNNMNGGCNLPGAGTVVLVPRPTASPLPPELVNAPPTAVPFNNQAAIFQPGEICVEEGDTLTSLALKANTSLRRVCELNPLPDGLDCRGCDFSESDVGSCPNPPVLSLGQCFVIPGATFTPTATQPPTGDETATPTPTHRAPAVVFPQNGGYRQWGSPLTMGIDWFAPT